jgi:polysaccharide biosynthesis protein PslJ
MTDLTVDLASVQSQERRVDSVTLLTVYLFVLMAIPSALVFAPLGGAGAPSTIVGAILFIWYILNWLHPASAFGSRRLPMRSVSIVFLCAVLASYAAANRHALPALELNGADRGLILTCGWLGVLLLAADGIGSMERLRTLLQRIVFGATALSVLGIVQFFTGLDAARYIVIPGLVANQPYIDVSLRDSLNRVSATAIHPIEFGFVLAVILPIAIHQARHAKPGFRVRRWLQVAAIAATMPMTVSRSAMLGLAVSLIVILPTWPRRDRWTAIIVTVFSFVALRAVIPGLLGTLRDLFLEIGSDSSTKSRTAAFGHASPLISAHPFFGQGFGTFLPNVFFFTDDQYLNSLIEIGVVGIIAIFALFTTGWLLARGARRISDDAEIRHLGQCLAASAAVMIVCYATFDAFYFNMAAGLTFLVLGCIGALWRLVKEEGSSFTSGRCRESSLDGSTMQAENARSGAGEGI